MGRDGSKKSQMLLVAELLRMFTDDDHGLTADEIARVVELRVGKRPSETKVLDDIHALANNAPFGSSIEVPSRGKNTGFRCTKTFITSEQARLLINMVRTCKFISPAQRDELCEALHCMVSYHQQDVIVESVVVDERELPISPDVFGVADVAYRAIKHGRMIEFHYVLRDARGEEFFVRNPDDSDFFCEAPIDLVYSFGNYYVETWSDDAGKRFARRLDRMRDTRVSGKESLNKPEINALRSSVRERLSQQFDMWGDDNPVTLFLFAKSRGIGYVYDRFGPSVKFREIDRSGSSGYLCVNVLLGPTFYRWLFGMGDYVSLVKPKNEIWVGMFVGDMSGSPKSFGELVDDYQTARDGIVAMLNVAIASFQET